MAIYRRGNTWWTDYRDRKGRRVRLSLRTTELAQAQRLVAELEERDATSVTLEDLLDQWCHAKIAGTTKQRSQEVYDLARRRFSRLWGHLPAEDFPADTIREWRDQRVAEGTSRVTANQDIGHFLAALRWAKKRGLIEVLPTVERLKVPRRRIPKELNQTQLDALTAAVQSGRFRRLAPMIYLAYYCGLRMSEILWLQWDDVDLTNGWIHVRCKPHLGWSPKSEADRAIPVHPKLAEFLKAWREEVPDDPEDWVCPQVPGQRWDRKYCVLTARELFKHAGVDVRGARHRLHMLRGTFATRYLRNGGDLESLRDILGHSDIKITAVYLSSTAESKRRGLNGL